MLDPAGAPRWHQPPPRLSPHGVEEPETCYHQRLEASRPTGFYRDALRTYAGMLSLLAWQELPVVTDDNLVEGRVAPNRLTAPEGVS